MGNVVEHVFLESRNGIFLNMDTTWIICKKEMTRKMDHLLILKDLVLVCMIMRRFLSYRI
jgi:hypothetical protein